GSNKALHRQVLLQRLEKQLDLPPLFVDGGNGSRAELEQVGEQDDLALVLRIPDDNPAQGSGAIELRLDAGELNDLVGADVAIRRDLEFRLDGEDGIVLHAGDKEYVGQSPAGEQSVVGVAAVHGHDGAAIEREGIGQFD